MSFFEVVVKTVSGKEIAHEMLREHDFDVFSRKIRRSYNIVEWTASARTTIIVED
jgi:hypothetical protein